MPAVVEARPDDNISDVLVHRVRTSPDAPLFSLPDGHGGWSDVTASEFHRQVVALAKGLVSAGIEPGERIGMMCRTRYEWTLVDFAVFFAGGVLVPVYETSSPGQVHWNMQDSGAVAMILESAEHFSRFDEVHPELPAVRRVWQIDLGDLDKLAEQGVDVPDAEIERRRNIAVGSDMATLIYTSGTTGRPKGCILTHANFVELARNAEVAMEEVVRVGASTLLFITTAHVFARFISILNVQAGVKTGHQADTTQLLPALASFKPTFLLAVPRVFEKVYNSSEQKAEGAGRGKVFRKAAEVAYAHSVAVDAGRVPLALKLQYKVFDALVYSKIRQAMGGRVRFAVSGSAPLGLRLGHFYRSLGLTILEGYGLTETTAPVSVNLVKGFRIGTVGPALPGVSTRITDEGEIEVKGVNVFDGYWQDEEATAAVFDDGWFRTGDLGSYDADGYLTITGRKKEIIVTAGGKNVAPAALEDPIRANPLVGQVVVAGDRRPFISALVTLDPEMLKVWLGNNGQDPAMTLEQASQNPAVLAEVQRAVDAANATVSRAESIRKFVVLPVELTEAAGHLTPKLSIKRQVVLDAFGDVVTRIYEAAPDTEGHSLVH
ncbi:Long-chain-fatty-acid--CoA ligase FadD15 [Clavibacter michiganensis]|uniref:Acyl-CoA synthetase n=2 Tax=Clavibacter michiganensis TaxID=28447 RepID=A0A251YUZ0_9MICO|nr:Long-chain-fatty-acid--CoA ligase FadD15 [Clavibacter michiganensis]